jgi:ribosomal subunit interface protein
LKIPLLDSGLGLSTVALSSFFSTIKTVYISIDMKVTIHHKDINLTSSLEVYIAKKVVEPVRRLFKGVESEDIPVLDLEFSRTTRHHRKGKVYYAEATITLGKVNIRAEAVAEDMRAACDMLKDELGREITHFKTRREALRRQGARKVKRELRYAPEARVRRGGEGAK